MSFISLIPLTSIPLTLASAHIAPLRFQRSCYEP
jgi:hypothetical protein